jgi:hypothetical protein
MGARANPDGRPAGPDSPSYGGVVRDLAGLLAALAALGYVVATTGRPVPKPTVSTPAPAPTPPPAPVVVAEPEPPPRPAPTEPEPEPPKLDREAVARAEAELDALSRDRARAEARAEEAGRRLAGASAQAAADTRAAKDLAFRVRDPSPRIAQAAARGGFLKGERAALKKELDQLARAPRPKAKVLSNKNPVARPSDGDEHHFEVRRNRVAYVDLDRLISLVKADAQLRIRLSEGARLVDNQVGPVGAFSLHYVLGRSLPSGLDDLMERRGFSYDLRGWEVVPMFEGRGEPFETTRQPFSEYARVLNRLNPARSTITMWVYPDGFALFRKLRDDLHARGFLVAARPLPDGMSIRGSPAGSLSAGQ